MQEYFSILGCDGSESPEAIRKAWRKKCLENHPDHGGNQEIFLQIMHSYKMITDPSYRLKEKAPPVRDLTFRIQIVVDFVEAFYGTKISLSYSRIYLDSNLELLKHDKIEPVVISFDLPPGHTNCYEYSEKGKGCVCDSIIGDVIARVMIKPHSRYTVRGVDVFADEKIPLDILLKGGEVTIETLWGHKVIWVPPGTQPGNKIKIADAGVEKKGCQYSVVIPLYPNENELRSEAWHGLNINWVKAEQKNKEDEELIKKFEELKKNGSTF